MSLIQDLEDYVVLNGYVTQDQLDTLQFEIGERVRAGSTQWDDLYATLLKEKITENEGNLALFNQQREERVLGKVYENDNRTQQDQLSKHTHLL